MPRLLEWHGPMADPAMAGTQSNEERIEHLAFRAEFDEPACSSDVYNLRECPTLFESYEFNGRVNNGLFVIDRECRALPESPNIVDVRIKYSSKWASQFDGKYRFIPNPLERPALVEWSHYTAREAVETAKGDEESDVKIPVTTTAGEPLILEEEFHRRRLVVTKNVKSIDDDVFAESGDFINQEDTRIGGHLFKKLTLWLWPIEIGPLQFENGFFYYQIVMTILHNPNTWIRRVRNAGYYMKSYDLKVITTPGGRRELAYPLIPIRFDSGVKADRPILLDKKGRPIQAVVTQKSVGAVDGEAGFVPTQYIVKSPDDFGRAFTEAELKETTRYFRTRDKLNFTQKLPLR